MKFTRKQLIFVVTQMLCAPLDHFVTEADRDPPYRGVKDLDELKEALVESASWNLSIFAAQVTGKGVACSDAIEVADVDGWLMEAFKNRTMTPTRKPKNVAQEWVDTIFAAYLKGS